MLLVATPQLVDPNFADTVVLLLDVDEAGALGRLTTLIGDAGANIVEVRHVRDELTVHARSAAVEVTVETPDAARMHDLVARLRGAGYEVTPHVPL